jgi:serine/threonine protein kinase
VKPQNVLVTPTGAKLCDFGCAKRLDESAMNLTALLPAMRTQPGFSLGTPQYMAPEVLRGEHPSDAISDQFAWGLVAYQLIVGKPAPRESYIAKWTAPKVDVVALDPRVARAVERALAADRSLRFASMEDVVAELAPRDDEEPTPPTRLASVPDLETSSAIRREPSPAPRVSAAPPAQEARASSPARGPRPPKRDLLQPFVDAILAELSVAVPLGFRKAVVTVTVDVSAEKARYSLHVVALDESAELWSLEASGDAMRAAGALIASDAADGNTRWRRLVLRLQRGRRDASVAEIV